MAAVNKRLLPIKTHYLCFMGAMGPILPQLPVLGKQIGISAEVMGYITSVLPILYVLAKPLFGFVADYFSKLRKVVFMFLISVMTVFFLALYFVPNTPVAASHLLVNDSLHNVTVRPGLVGPCDSQIMILPQLCRVAAKVSCSADNWTFDVYLLRANASSGLHLLPNVESLENVHACLPPTESSAINERTEERLLLTCHVDREQQSQCLYGSKEFWLFVVFMCVGTIGFNVVNSISDAICFDMLGESKEHKYGAQRVWGTIGFGLTALLAGIAVDLWTQEAVKSFTPALIIMAIFSAFDLASVSKLSLPKLSSSESIFRDVWDLVKHPSIVVFLLFATIAGIIDSFIIYFMFWHLEEVAMETGYMEQIKLIEGCVVAAECLAGEVPFFFYSGKIIRKLGYVHCMSLCFFFYAIRLSLIAWIPNPWYLVGVELFFQGCTYALCYTCIVAYASAVAPPGTSATVQGLMAGMDDGLGFSIGSLLGGISMKRFGGRNSFMYFAIAAICTCVAHILLRPRSRKKQYLPKGGYHVPKEQVTVTLTTDEAA